MNFWSMLLAAVVWLVRTLVIPLFGGEEGMHAALGLASIIGNGAYVVLELLYATFGMFNLQLVGIAFGLVFFSWLIDMGIKIYFFVTRLIKALPFL